MQLEKPAVDVNLHTVERIEAILRDAGDPVSRNQEAKAAHLAIMAQFVGALQTMR